jgi:hypothetical protein
MIPAKAGALQNLENALDQRSASVETHSSGAPEEARSAISKDALAPMQP